MKKLKDLSILHIDSEGGFGGSSRSLFELAIELRGSFKSQIVWVRQRGPALERYTKHCIEVCVVKEIVSRIPLRANNFKNGLTGLIQLYKFLNFYRRLSKLSPDIVHFNYDGLLFLAAYTKLLSPEIKTVTHARYKWPNNCAAKIYAKLISFGSDKIIAISNDVACSLRDAGVEDEKISILHNSSSLTKMKYRIKSQFSILDQVSISFFGTLNYQKNSTGLIALADELEARGVPFKIKIYGQPPRYRSLSQNLQVYRDALATRAERSTQRYNFCVCGHTNRPEEEIASSHFVTRPSILRDPWGRDVIETMCCGRVIIATGDKSDFVDNGRNGFLVGDWQAKKVASIICALRENPDRYEEICNNAQNDARALFEPSANSLKFKTLLEELIYP